MLSLNSLALQHPKQEVALAAGPGIEPGLWDSKSRVLPLHHPATLTILSRTHLENKSDSPFTSLKYAVAWCCAEVAELADAADSKSAEVNSRVGSSPTFGTRTLIAYCLVPYLDLLRVLRRRSALVSVEA